MDYYSPVLAPPSSATVVTSTLAALGSRSMAFLGDSMMFQTTVGFECEALSEGWAIVEHTDEPREKVRERAPHQQLTHTTSFADANAICGLQTHKTHTHTKYR